MTSVGQNSRPRCARYRYGPVVDQVDLVGGGDGFGFVLNPSRGPTSPDLDIVRQVHKRVLSWSSWSRNCGAAIAAMPSGPFADAAAAQVARRRYSVTTASTSDRDVVTTPPSSAVFIVDCPPEVARRAKIDRLPESAAARRVDLAADRAVYTPRLTSAPPARSGRPDRTFTDTSERAAKVLADYGCNWSAGTSQAGRRPGCTALSNPARYRRRSARGRSPFGTCATPLSRSRSSPSVTIPM